MCYRYCSKLFGILRREIKFRYYCCRNSTKSMREKKKRWREKMLNFDNDDTEFPLPSSATHVWSARSEKEKIKNKKLTNELWQYHCRNRGINFFIAIVAMTLWLIQMVHLVCQLLFNCLDFLTVTAFSPFFFCPIRGKETDKPFLNH